MTMLHRCTECHQPALSWTYPPLPPFDPNNPLRESPPPTLEPCGHEAFTYCTGETMTYPQEGTG